jgi:hypothetical protein
MRDPSLPGSSGYLRRWCTVKALIQKPLRSGQGPRQVFGGAVKSPKRGPSNPGGPKKMGPSASMFGAGPFDGPRLGDLTAPSKT